MKNFFMITLLFSSIYNLQAADQNPATPKEERKSNLGIMVIGSSSLEETLNQLETTLARVVIELAEQCGKDEEEIGKKLFDAKRSSREDYQDCLYKCCYELSNELSGKSDMRPGVIVMLTLLGKITSVKQKHDCCVS